MCKKLRVVLVLFMVMAQFLLLSWPLSAESPTPIIPAKFVVQPDGTWSASVKNGALIGTEASISVQVLEPRVDPRVVAILGAHGVDSAALVKNLGEFDLQVNNVPAAYLSISEGMIQQVVQTYAPSMDYWATRIYNTNASLSLFVAQESALNLGQRVAAPPEARNVVALGLTLSPEGKPLSAVGISLESMPGLAAMPIGGLVEQLGLENAEVKMEGFGVSVATNGEEQLRLAVNPALIGSTTPLVYELLARQYGAQDRQVVDYITAIREQIDHTRLHLTVNIADTPQPEARTIHLEDTVQLILKPEQDYSGATRPVLYLGVEGQPIANLASWLTPPVSTLVEEVGSVAIAWDGSTGALVSALGDKRMPIIRLDEGLLEEIGGIFVPQEVPWEMVRDVKVGVILSKSGTPGYMPHPGEAQVYYDPQPAFMLAPKLVADRSGTLAVDAPELGKRAAIPNANVAGFVPLLEAYPNLKSVQLAIKPGGIDVGVNGRALHVVMDSEARQNLLKTLPPILPLLNVNIDPRLTQPRELEFLTNLLAYDPTFTLGMDLGFLGPGESIPAGSLEDVVSSLAASFGALLGK